MDIDEFVKNPLSQVVKRSRRKQAAPPEEYDPGMLSTLADVGVSGLSMVGNVLDLPGSSVRDILAGENPLDQWLPWNWTSSEGRTSGRDLLRQHRLIGRRDHWSNWLGGAAAEIALDPTTYLTLGGSALTKAGKLGKAAGLLDDVTKLRKVGPRQGRMLTTLEDLVSGVKTPAGEFAEGAASSVKARRALEEAARAAKVNLGDVYDMPLGGLAAPIGPLQDLAGATGVWGRAGGIGEKVARGMDIAGRTIAESPVGRATAMVFNPAVRGLFGKEEQKLAKMVTNEQLGAAPLGRSKAFGVGDVVNPAIDEFSKLAGDEIMKAAQRRVVGPAARAAASAPPELARQAGKKLQKAMDEFSAIDRATEIRRVADAVARHVGEKDVADALKLFDIDVPAEHLGGIKAAVDKLKVSKDNLINEINDMGGGTTLIDEEDFSHIARYANVSDMASKDRHMIQQALQREADIRGVQIKQLPEDVTKRIIAEATPSKSYKLAGTKTAVDKARSHARRTVPTAVLNRMATDENIRVALGTPEGQVQATNYIIENYGTYLDAKYKAQSKTVAANELANWAQRNQGRPGFARMLDQQIPKLNTPQLTPAARQHAWELAQDLRTHSAREQYTNELLVDNLRYHEAGNRKLGMLKAIHHYVQQNAGTGPGISLDEAFKAAGMDDKAVQWFASKTGKSLAEAQAMTVPHDVAAAIGTMMRTDPATSWGKSVGDAIDWVNDLIRSNVTSIFPSFHFRNLSSGQYINFATGAMQSPSDILLYRQEVLHAMKMARDPSDPFWREIETYRVHGIGSGERGTAGVARGFEDVPYHTRRKQAGVEAQYNMPEFMSRNPLTAAIGKPYEAARRLGERALEGTEFYNRVPLYLYFRKKGYSAAQAALEVKKRHFDYSELTPIERNLFRRSFLFYSFTRKMAPLVAQTLIERPGGLMAQTIKQVGKAHDQQVQPIPEYIKETAAIPLPPDVGGNLRFITGLGLPHEDILGFAPSPMQEILSRTSPLIKAPIELATGQSLFQRGRPLEDLDPSVGRTISNVREFVTGEKQPGRARPFLGQPVEFAIANSPLSRISSTARMLTDPRKSLAAKAVNLLTGARITDVSPAAQDAEIGNRAAQVLKRLGGRTFVKPYLPAETKEQLSPEELNLLQGVELLTRQRAMRARQRAAER